jgi:hypothetical protein
MLRPAHAHLCPRLYSSLDVINLMPVWTTRLMKPSIISI